MSKQVSLFTPADELTDVLGPDLAAHFPEPMDLFRRGRPKIVGLDFIEYHSIPEPNTGCWLWLGNLDRAGYPKIKKRSLGEAYAHRYSLSCVYGPLGDLHALHHCDNPICVNPVHLFAGTNLDNNRDMVAKGRARHPRGESNGLSKLTEAEVRSIRAAFVPGALRALAAEHAVTTANIRSIITGRSWGHLQ